MLPLFSVLGWVRMSSGLLLVVSALVAPAAAKDAKFDKPKLDRFMDRIAEKNKGMGRLVVAKDGNVLYDREIGFGRVNGAVKEPLTAASRFRIGSISKMFTGVLALQLVEAGKLKLDDALDGYFPQVPNAKKITIAQLLGHRSGIFNVTDDRQYRTWKSKPIEPDAMIALIARGKPEFEPDAKYSYSNSNFVLLGYIVEKISGRTLADLLQERIAGPLGLKDTYLATGLTDVGKNEVTSYRFVRDWEPMEATHMSVPAGAGGVVSTAADLVMFIQALFDLKLISQRNLDRMTREKFAMLTFGVAGETLYGHGGSIDGFRATLVYLPKERLAVAYTANASVYPSQEFVPGVVQICRNQPFAIPSFEAFVVGDDLLDQYVGDYASETAPVTFKVTREGTKLLAGPTGRPAAPLTAVTATKFKIEGSAIEIEFDAAKHQMTMRRPGRQTVFTKESRTK